MLADTKKLEALRNERSLVLIKPDAVKRQIAGEIISRFERKGFKLVAMKMAWADEAKALEHYPLTEEWIEDNGGRTYQSYIDKGEKPPLSARELALNAHNKLQQGITAGPVLAMVWQGAHVIESMRKMRGATSPNLADVGTIGFDYSVDSYALGDSGDWAIRNVIHASDSPENAEREIAVWFKPDEVHDYSSAVDHILYSKDFS